MTKPKGPISNKPPLMKLEPKHEIIFLKEKVEKLENRIKELEQRLSYEKIYEYIDNSYLADRVRELEREIDRLNSKMWGVGYD